MTSPKIHRNHFAKALKQVRKSRNLSQEDFALISSRTYISTLERGLKSPTLAKVEDLAALMSVHPLTLLVLAYAKPAIDGGAQDVLLAVSQEVDKLQELHL